MRSAERQKGLYVDDDVPAKSQLDPVALSRSIVFSAP